MKFFPLSSPRDKKNRFFYGLILFFLGGALFPLIGQTSFSPNSPRSLPAEKSLDSDQQALLSEMQESFRRMLDKQDKELDGLLKELKKAPKEKKIDYLTLIVTRLIEQRKEMHQEMDAMRIRMRELKSLSPANNIRHRPPQELSSDPSAASSSPSESSSETSSGNETPH
ncbi:hypothetical protein EM20IM_07060 [Candidatus Methylacidiphilum infernorum]|uniref:Uncharacterized protein n=1 Tax=Candidatus Methylacidiphilum infernorum TaxID=511746 RepID=A0ABX7PTF0_9BACT|nr:hypothetical protein [Candidatus Methylacidiphilum infernorum]QSR86257.1 hypothetical protein EM20IM_07060 [Candidatus Methylacidiphilum infernorum]